MTKHKEMTIIDYRMMKVIRRKIIFVVDSLSQPRCIKRILSFVHAGYECEVYGYDRNKYNCNSLPKDIPVTVLGEMHDGVDYFKKLKMLRQDIRGIVIKHKNESPVYYSFGFISTLLFFLKRQDYVYEISDILYGYPRFSKVLWLFKALDKRIIKKSVATVMTSEGFYEFFGLKNNNIIIQPNKVNSSMSNVERKRLQLNKDSGLVFSFVGAIRYDTVFRFAEIVGSYFPHHQFHFYGQASDSSSKRIKDLMEKYSNIKSFGAFKNPDDLEKIYNAISIVVACYTPSSLNERIAEPNKLYEAMFFCKPIVVSDGTFLSRQVKRFDCGFCLDATNEQNIIDFIKNLDAEECRRISEIDANRDVHELLDNPDSITKRVTSLLL